jgi:putative zinc finger protein
MTNHIQCNEFAERLADLLEREADEPTRAALEAHALSCADCGSVLADLRKLRVDASNMPLLEPSRDLWDDISRRIDAPVIPLPTGKNGFVGRDRRWGRWVPIAAAAVVLVALTSLTTYYLTLRSHVEPTVTASIPPVVADSARGITIGGQTPAQAVASLPVGSTTAGTNGARPNQASPVAPAPSNVRLVNHKVSAAEAYANEAQVYSREIARLHAIVERRRAQLDPATINVIERNLKVIDDAITQCRLALAKDPASRYLIESLNNALETKVELLRTATMLPTHSS